MIGAEDVRVDLRVGDAWGDGAARQPVVDTPADVAGAGVGPMRPPGVFLGRVRMGCSKGIDKTSVEVILKAFALFVGKAMFADVGLGIGQVDFGMGDVHIAAVQHGFCLLEAVASMPSKLCPSGRSGREPAESPLLLGV